MHELVFVVKVSKFCNLRCAYCYEHRELHVRDRMRFETLERLIAGIDDFGDWLRRQGIAPRFSFVWHGGEPLLLPPEYYERIAAFQQRSIRRYAFRNSVQTNLHGINKASLGYVLESNWELGVSIDFADGVRCNAGGRESNARVIAAAEALRNGGGRFGVISVLGSHNRDTLAGAYDWVSEFAEGWRILPVFAGGPEDEIAALQLPEEDVARVFAEVFEKRARAARHIGIDPLDEYLKAAVLQIAGDRAAGDTTRPLLDNIFVIDVNGDVFTRPFAYDARYCLGNVNDNSAAAMLDGETYRKCQSAIARRKEQNCVECDYRGFCDSSFMHEHGSTVMENGRERCAVPRGTMAALENALTEAEVTPAIIGEWAREWLASPERASGAA